MDYDLARELHKRKEGLVHLSMKDMSKQIRGDAFT